MATGFWIAVAIVAGVVLYVVLKVIAYSRRSDRQWAEVDKSKLREWDDEEW